jgi:hypothetical protein
VQETKGVDDANLSSNKKPTQEIEGNVLKKK